MVVEILGMQQKGVQKCGGESKWSKMAKKNFMPVHMKRENQTLLGKYYGKGNLMITSWRSNEKWGGDNWGQDDVCVRV